MSKPQRLIIDSVILGIVGGLGAQLFTWMLRIGDRIFLQGIAGYMMPGLPEEGGVLLQRIGSHGLWLIPLATTLGGLIAGILVYSLVPEAEGHGTDTAIKAYHASGGFIRARVAPLKMIASAITIGSGGSAGREGPTALISAGVGSFYASMTHRTDEDHRTFLLIGMAAGLSAIFRSPIGTAIFSVEVLYNTMEFDTSVLLYTMLGAIVAYTVNGLFVGFKPLFNVPGNIVAPDAAGYLWYLALGIIAGLVGVIFPYIFYQVRDLFKALRIPPHFKPAIGGLGVGLIALFLPQVLGGGYGWIQEAIDGNIALTLMLLLVFGKIVALALTISSGGSGGVFAPGLFIGAMLGGTLAKIFHQPDAAFVIVSMAAVFAGAARVPIATLLMVAEMTGGFQLLVPAALAITISYMVQEQFSERLKYCSLYEWQVEGRPDSPAHQSEIFEHTARLLAKRNYRVSQTISHLDLNALLETGVAVDLPGDERLMIGDVQTGSAYIGRQAIACFPPDQNNQADLVGVLRDNKLLFPESDLQIESGDRLLLILTPDAWVKVEKHLVPSLEPPPQNNEPSQPESG